MRGLIYITGNIEDVFFHQEIDFFNEKFDKIIVMSIEGNPQMGKLIAEEKKISIYTINRKINLSILMDFIKFLNSINTKKERREALTGRGIIKKFAYLCFYGYTCISAKRIYENILNLDLNECDEIYVYSYYLTRGALIASWIAMDEKYSIKNIVARGHGYDLYEERNALNYLPFRNLVFEKINTISLISNHGYSYFRKRYPQFKDKAVVYYLGTLNKKGIQKVIKMKDEVVIASCSAVVSVKRVDIIIDFICYMNSTKKFNVRWIHIGDGELLHKMKCVAQKKLPAHSYLFLGKVENSKILDTLVDNDVDYLINMSDSEGLPVSMMEASSVGIPVIARNVGGVSEIVGDGCGFLIGEIDEQAFTKIVRYIQQRLTNVDEYKKESERCIKRWSELFNAEKNHRRFIQEVLINEKNDLC